VAPAPARGAGEGEGPYTELILRGATVIDGTGAPPYRSVDVVIRGNRIAEIVRVGAPGTAIADDARPKPGRRRPRDRLSRQYLLPGFIDMHGHIGGEEQGTPAEYVYKLWLGHGITSIRDPGCGNGIDFLRQRSARSAGNRIVAPRIFPYAALGLGSAQPIATPSRRAPGCAWRRRRACSAMKCFGATRRSSPPPSTS
jgi:N-acyl-D-aspartate/D-glutamate deacylase